MTDSSICRRNLYPTQGEIARLASMGDSLPRHPGTLTPTLSIKGAFAQP